MDDETAPAPIHPADPVAGRENRTSLVVATLTAGIGATLFMSGLAHAEPMISTAKTLSESGMLPNMSFVDERVLFGALTFGFSLLAAGVWHRSFRAVTNAKRASRR